MRMRSIVYTAFLALFLLTLGTTVLAQPAPNVTGSPTREPQIVYTGNLFGYFRTPSHQSMTSVGTCPAQITSDDYSPAANLFLAVRNNQKNALSPALQAAIPAEYSTDYLEKVKGAVLVGTGDNFAPRLEARQFYLEPDPKSERYVIRNKEPYFWDGKEWTLNPSEELRESVHAGQGTIPNDNVACFLAAAHFAALVPGKHDFYYGPERLRELARLLASSTSGGSPAPQMLAANLVIKTNRIAPVPFSRAKEQRWPADLAVARLDSVYPWFSSSVAITVQPSQADVASELKKWIAEQIKSGKSIDDEELRKFLQGKIASNSKKESPWEDFSKAVASLDSLYVCGADESAEPGAITPSDCEVRGRRLPKPTLSVKDGQLSYSLETAKPVTKATEKPPNFVTGENGLCMHTAGNLTAAEKCMQFSVFAPFFSYPSTNSKPGYTDPDPFVLVPKSDTRSYDVAIFGVVDPTIGEHVGVLNFSWLNIRNNPHVNKDVQTIVSAEDPVKALNQQLEYFKRWYKSTHEGQPFAGVKVLLAQMSPERARVLAARLPEFQIVVAGADNLQTTTHSELTTTWSADVAASAFVAVPSPYARSDNKVDSNLNRKLEGQIHFGAVEPSAQPVDGHGNPRWGLKAVEKPAIEVWVPNVEAGKDFKRMVTDGFKKCVSASGLATVAALPIESVTIEHVKWLTLCAMRQELGADVALLQARDLWDELPPDSHDEPEHTRETVQQALDRIIWKGDLLTLLYVPGSALKSALKQSDAFAREDANPLSLADEKARKLEYAGITKSGDEYLIDEIPISDSKIYAIATSDYIGAGDTGYPGLAAAALDPKNRAIQFSSPLETISSVVCRKLFNSDNEARRFCLEPSPRNDSLDKMSAKAAPSGKPPGFWQQLWNKQPFKWPKAVEEAKSTDKAVERNTQGRPIWTLSLKNFSVGFDGLTKNLSDAEVAQKFTGVPIADITTQKNSSVRAQVATRLSRTSHANEFFTEVTADFKQRSTGDVSPRILQIENRGTGGIGLIQNLRGGRSVTRVGVALYVRAEVPLQKPFSTFSLSAQDRLRVTQDRNLLVLPRLGLRWQNRDNSFEGGVQGGREINAFAGYSFNTNGTVASCTPNPAETFAACVNRLIKAGTVTKNSVASAILENRPRMGLYSRLNLTVPFTDKVKYVLSEEGDFFFNFHGDNSIDTRLRDISKHSLKFAIWPSFSIGPSLQILLYRNKVNGDFLFQRQFGFETTLSFDLFNHREKMVQIKYKKP